jgi:site-specific recombinase XerD
MDYDEYDRECEKIIADNQAVLEGFADWLIAKGLVEKTIQNHIDNIDFYINVFLLHEELLKPGEGVSRTGLFFGYFFIRKALWSSVATMRQNAASMKKFYSYLNSIGLVSDDDLQDMKDEIKGDLPKYLADMEAYDSGVYFSGDYPSFG